MSVALSNSRLEIFWKLFQICFCFGDLRKLRACDWEECVRVGEDVTLKKAVVSSKQLVSIPQTTLRQLPTAAHNKVTDCT